VPIEDSIGIHLRRAYLTMHRTAQAYFAPFGVTVDQYVLLSLLADEDEVTQAELVERMSSDANTIGAMLRLLEAKELVRRERCELDGRARRVHLTPKGRRLQEKLIRGAEPLHQRIDESLTQAQRAALFTALDRLTQALARDVEPRQVG